MLEYEGTLENIEDAKYSLKPDADLVEFIKAIETATKKVWDKSEVNILFGDRDQPRETYDSYSTSKESLKELGEYIEEAVKHIDDPEDEEKWARYAQCIVEVDVYFLGKVSGLSEASVDIYVIYLNEESVSKWYSDIVKDREGAEEAIDNSLEQFLIKE